MNKFKDQVLDSKTFADIDDAELGKGLLEGSTDTDTDSSTTSTSSRSWWHRWYKAIIGISALLCATNLLTFWITASARLQCQATESVAEPPKLTPMLRDLNLKTIHVKFDSTFFSQGSRYRKPPSPETDAAWNYAGANCMYHICSSLSQFICVSATPLSYHYGTDFQAVGYILIPEEHASESDLTTNNIHFAGGSDQAYMKGYPANVEVFHQIHCLVWPRFFF